MDQNADFMQFLAENAIYMMGVSFIVGSLFTIFILVIFDMIKQIRSKEATKKD